MPSKVFITRSNNRSESIQSLLEQMNLSSVTGKRLAVKPNFNSADPFPASTHIDTLRTFILKLKEAGAESILLADRSGIGDTQKVLTKTGVMKLAEELDFEVVVLNELSEEGWVHHEAKNSHWKRGFLMAKVFHDADMIVQTCCLKTHQYGGHFTLSLKNAVGMIAGKDPSSGYDYMRELHSSMYQRQMIAEINTVFETPLILMDAIKAFVRGGPAHGVEVEPNLLLAGSDRVAIDAVGVAILRHFGTTLEVTQGKIFNQEQLARAVELGIDGTQAARDIELVPLDEESTHSAHTLAAILKE
jgi:uncharacterized protein (DUF362 family)